MLLLLILGVAVLPVVVLWSTALAEIEEASPIDYEAGARPNNRLQGMRGRACFRAEERLARRPRTLDPLIRSAAPHIVTRNWRRSVVLLGLRTVIYKTPDLAQAKAWYSEMFGITPYFDEPYYVGFNVCGYELGLDPGHGHAARSRWRNRLLGCC